MHVLIKVLVTLLVLSSFTRCLGASNKDGVQVDTSVPSLGTVENLQKAGLLDSAIQIAGLLINDVDLLIDGKRKEDVLFTRGNLYRAKAKYAEAIEDYQSALEICVRTNDKSLEARVLNSIGGVYFELMQYDKSIEFISKALNIYTNHFPELVSDICLINTNLGNISISMGEYERAFEYLERADNINKDIQNDYYGALIHSGMGLSYLNVGELDKSENEFRTALDYSIKAENVQSEIAVLANLGNLYKAMGNYMLADSIMVNALDKANQVGDKYLITQVLQELIDLNEVVENYKGALSYQKQFMAYRDSMVNMDLKSKLISAELKYENIQKENQIIALNSKSKTQEYKLKQNRYFLIIAVSIFGLIILIALLIYQRNRYHQREKISDMENKMFRLQIKPHFIFNVLSSIQNYVGKSDGKEAKVYLAKFARLIRNVLEQTQNDYISIAREIQLLEYYSDLQRLRFDNQFDFEVIVDDAIDPEEILVPPMIIQPLIENSIEHGLKNISYKGLIQLNFKKSDESLIIEIADNGVGMDYSQLKSRKEDKISMSHKIINEQLLSLSKREKRQFKMLPPTSNVESDNGNGCIVRLELPLIYNLD